MDSHLEAFFNPRHVGEVAEPNFIGRAASFQCGATVRVSLNIDDSLRITDAKFKAAGCSVLVGAASQLLDQVIGKTTAETATLIQSRDLNEKFADVPREKDACLRLATDALLTAIRSYSDSARDQWEGDEALICTCFCVSDRTIEREIREQQLQTIAEVTRACNAGAGCRSCYSLIEEILEGVNRE